MPDGHDLRAKPRRHRHNVREFTPDADLVAGANVLLDVVHCLALAE